MSTPTPPNNPNLPPKKTTEGAKPTSGSGNGQSTSGQKPAQKPAAGQGQTQGAKPSTQGQGAKTPAQGQGAAKPSTSANKPAQKSTPAGAPSQGAKPSQAAAQPAPQKKPQPAKNLFSHIDANTLQLAKKLEDLGFLDGPQIETLYEEMRTSDATLGELAQQRGLLNEEQLLQAMAELHGMRVANLEDVKPEANAVKLVMKNIAEMYKLVPLTYENDVLTVAMSDPNNMQAMDDLRNLLGIKQVNPVLAPPKQIEVLLTKAYSAEKEESIGTLIQQLESSDIGAASMGRENSIDLDDVMEMANAAPVRKLINMVLLMSIRDHASDIHFEPFEDEYKMRYRCDGVLYEMVPPPRHLANAIATRIKVMANLDIAERRMPQDGRIELNVGGNRVDLRVNVLPTMFGESSCIRVLDKGNVGLDLNRTGMEAGMLGKFRDIIKKPNGIILVTGPTGSGKTTTLYSALNELNEVTDKIITTEDPVEYEIDGICQVPINSDIGVTFAACLRSILRQDPDTILVGEIRDLETAQIAVQASLTGHMVFSTLHTNDAPSSITRLRDMGVEPFLIIATLEGILAQRLVRKICQDCRTEFEPSPELLMELNLKPADVVGKKFY